MSNTTQYWGLDSAPSIPAAFFSIAKLDLEMPVYSQASFDGQLESVEQRRWNTATYAETSTRILKIAHFLKSVGVQKGSKVAIVSTSRPEWMEVDLAILACGGISVSVYQTLPASEIAYILFDSGADIVFAENEEQVKKAILIHQGEWDIAATDERAAQRARIKIKKIVSFEDCFTDSLVVDFREILNGPIGPIPAEVSELTRDDIASFVYTSGTTGPPKGVVQTHGNHLSNVRQAAESGLYKSDSAIMLFLPLAHSFAKLMGYIGFITPASLKFIAIVDTKTSRMEPMSVSRDIREGSAKIVPIVPRLLEKMREAILRQTLLPSFQGKILNATINSAIEIYENSNAALKDRILFALTKPIRKKIRLKLFGPDFDYCVSGGAKLPVPVARFFDAIGIEILEGYGLTETCVATNVNRIGKKKIGTVGPVLSKDIEVKFLDDGEVLFRGPNIAKGYYERPKATEASWDADGWFHTGDLGSLDADGYLTITGRKKEIIVSSNGKKIAPNDIEDLIKGCPFVSQVLMYGEGRPYCVALITLNEEAIRLWARNTNKQLAATLSEDKSVYDLIWEHVTKVNSKIANFEQVRKIGLLPGDFTVDNALLTPTFKVKRKVVEVKFKDEIEGLYSK